MAYEYQDILTEEKGPVAIVTLNRPERMNAWSWRMALEARYAIAEFDSRDDIRVVIVTGAGRAFCAGADLSAGGRASAEEMDEVRRQLEAKTDVPYWEMATPLIAAMNGSAVGIGMTLPMQLDFRIMAEEGKYSFIFNRRGFVPELGSTWITPRLIGVTKAMDVMLTGRTFNGSEGAALGLANEALPGDRVLERATELANDIAENVAPVSAAITKRLIYRHLSEDDRNSAVERESALFRWSTSSTDGREGVKAFFEKRPPAWTMSKNRDLPQELLSD